MSEDPLFDLFCADVAAAAALLTQKEFSKAHAQFKSLCSAARLVGKGDFAAFLEVCIKTLERAAKAKVDTKAQEVFDAVALAVVALEPNKGLEERLTALQFEEKVALAEVVATPSIDASMYEIFLVEVQTHTQALSTQLLALEETPNNTNLYQPLMRAAHSLKGAARVIGLKEAVALAHALEDCFVMAQKGTLELKEVDVDLFLACGDIFFSLSKCSLHALNTWLEKNSPRMLELQDKLCNASANPTKERSRIQSISEEEKPQIEHALRVSSAQIEEIMHLAGATVIERSWIEEFIVSQLKAKGNQRKLAEHLELLLTQLRDADVSAHGDAQRLVREVERIRVEHTKGLSELDAYARRLDNVSQRLYRAAINTRMRPFQDIGALWPRMVRDLAKQLGKKVKLVIDGGMTDVDRDVLQKLDAPIGHILRNCCDHGLETPQERVAAAKDPTGTIRISVCQRAGMLHISISDDGRGVDPERVRKKIVQKGMTTAEIAKGLSEDELLGFLFLPGFSTVEQVSDVSGRGVGMDVVLKVVHEVGGDVKAINNKGKGLTTVMSLPLSLSLLRVLLCEVDGQTVAFPLARIERACMAHSQDWESNVYCAQDGASIPCVPASRLWRLHGRELKPTQALVILKIEEKLLGLGVDAFLGTKEIAVNELDARFSAIPDVNAFSVLEDATPLFVFDCVDLFFSIQHALEHGFSSAQMQSAPRILIVDDSPTVLEVEESILTKAGYIVDEAKDGLDGWNALRVGTYDVLVTDIDMPRLNGFELIAKVRADARFKTLPIVIVSYKDRDEDRKKAADAGVFAYLDKGALSDGRLVKVLAEICTKVS